MPRLKRLAIALAIALIASTVAYLSFALDPRLTSVGFHITTELFVSTTMVAWLWQTYRRKPKPGTGMRVFMSLAVGAMAWSICIFLLRWEMSFAMGYAILWSAFFIAAVMTWFWLTTRKWESTAQSDSAR